MTTTMVIRCHHNHKSLHMRIRHRLHQWIIGRPFSGQPSCNSIILGKRYVKVATLGSARKVISCSSRDSDRLSTRRNRSNCLWFGNPRPSEKIDVPWVVKNVKREASWMGWNCRFLWVVLLPWGNIDVHGNMFAWFELYCFFMFFH